MKFRRSEFVDTRTKVHCLDAHTKNERFHRRFKGGDFRIGRLPTCATVLQEVGILLTWFISNLRIVLR